MNYYMNKMILSAMLLLSTKLSASDGLVDYLSNVGKIYSVVAVIVIVFLGIILFLWRIDKRIDKIENHINNGK